MVVVFANQHKIFHCFIWRLLVKLRQGKWMGPRIYVDTTAVRALVQKTPYHKQCHLSSFHLTLKLTLRCGWGAGGDEPLLQHTFALCGKDRSCSEVMLCWMEVLRSATHQHASIIANTTLGCPWRASQAKLLSTATAPWCLSTRTAPLEHLILPHMTQHSVGADGSTESILNDKSTDVILLSDQQPQARKGSALLGLSGSIASTDGKLLADGVLIILDNSLNQ